ncbi:thioesterase family protein [Novosphingopyxis sp.]|uniref:thioesterase family protein n=1 Tax=Novosphingopyxis sp. TaxID=2709690 RepID=UPI003B58BAFD
MNLADILARLGANDLSADIPPGWMQGRTAYGGLSSAIALAAARTIADDLPPLKSGQIAFVGPIAETVTARPRLLRRGRNTAFVQVELGSQSGIGLIASFIFMNGRESSIAFDRIPDIALPPIPEDGKTRTGPPEYFTSQFDYPDKRLVLGTGDVHLANWHRLRDRGRLDGSTELMAIADALPPAAMGAMEKAGPVSTMNWQFNLLTDTPRTENGWWWIDAEGHQAARGSSSQYMSVRNARGEPVMMGMQSVAVFV